MGNINILSRDQTLTVSWKNDQQFKQFIRYQRAVLLKANPTNLGFTLTKDIINDTQQFFENRWNIALTYRYYDDLPDNPVVLDIGSGIGIIDVLAYKYLNNSGRFYLLDKSGIKSMLDHGTVLDYSPNYGYYHDWEVTRDVISNSHCEQTSFIMIEPISDWPEEIDLITSWASYCWHYPFNTYWNKIKQHLKIGGKLILEVSLVANDDSQIIRTISKEFNSTPVIRLMETGYRCVWIRKK